MKNRVIFPLLIGLLVSSLFSPKAFSQDTVVRVAPRPLGVWEDPSVVDIVIENGQNVAGYQVMLQFDSDKLEYAGIQHGDYLPSGSFFGEPQIIDTNPNDSLKAVLFAATAITGESNGDGVLATLTFKNNEASASDLTLLEGTILSNRKGETSIPRLENSETNPQGVGDLTERDDHGNMPDVATQLLFGVDEALEGTIESNSDIDYFKVWISDSGELRLYTTTTLTWGDVVIELQDSKGYVLPPNDDLPANDDIEDEDYAVLRIRHDVSAGTYYVKVTGTTENKNEWYRLRANFTPAETIDTAEELHIKEISGNAYISEKNKEPSFVVEVQDKYANPIPNVPVKFQIQNNSTLSVTASLSRSIVETNADGRARATLKLPSALDLDQVSGAITILAYVPEDTEALFPTSISDPDFVLFSATTEARTIDIKGPWLWMIAKGGPKVGPEGEEINIDDDLLNKQYTFDSEEYRAKHGAYKGERQGRNNTEEAIGDSIFWTPGKLNEDGNVNECLIQNRMLQGSVDHYTAYALINLFVEWKKWDGVILRLGSDDAVKVWLNGKEVHKHAELRSSDGYQDAIPVNLNLGDNLLMVKVSDHENGWGLFVGLDVPTGADITPKLPETLSEIQIQDELPLTIVPNPPVSEVAFGKESTYFVLTIGLPEFPVYGEDALIYRYKDAIIYDDCWITLVIEEEGISGFIFPLFEENTEESIKELVLRKSIEVVSDATGKVAGKVAGKAGGAVVGAVTVRFIGPLGFVLSYITANVLSYITADQVSRIVEENLTETLNPTEKDPTFQDPVFRIDVEGVSAGGWYLEYRQKYLVMVENRRLEEITMNVHQTYRFTFEETVEKTAPLHGTVHNELLNLKDIWATENSDPGAPSKRPMALSDYPPFQQLPPEVQAYILQHFEGHANHKAINAEAWQVPETTSLLPNYPNPFNPETWIPYQLSEPAEVKLTIYDINGRIVRDLDLGHQRAGIYQSRARAAHWDGRNAQGEPVASGIYFYTLKAGEFSATRKMLIRK